MTENRFLENQQLPYFPGDRWKSVWRLDQSNMILDELVIHLKVLPNGHHTWNNCTSCNRRIETKYQHIHSLKPLKHPLEAKTRLVRVASHIMRSEERLRREWQEVALHPGKEVFVKC